MTNGENLAAGHDLAQKDFDCFQYQNDRVCYCKAACSAEVDSFIPLDAISILQFSPDLIAVIPFLLRDCEV